ncbi:MAG TPA: ice-binding family protein [Burkholderiaceae bacterium]|jgi:hypothetical protein|nr:ice-binding family protein [Burkholderiaceae bacterium]
MKKLANLLAPLTWSIALLPAVFMAGCGGGNSSSADTTAASSAPTANNLSMERAKVVPQKAVNLGTAGEYVVLSETGISTVPSSRLTGNIGVSPISHTAITGFSDTLSSTGTYATSAQVVGKIYAADYKSPTPSNLTTAISDMETAYTDAAGRVLPNFTNLGAGQIGGHTLVPGLYKWNTGVSISTNVTLSGGPTDVWIFQISGNLAQAASTSVILAGGALPQNIFWQTTGSVSIGTAAHFSGVVLAKTLIAMKTGATADSRMLAQTAVTLEQNTVTQPGK